MKELFEKYKELSIAVLGDYCLDEYLWIDANLNEPSLETDMVAYQCVKRETSPGAAGTVANNLANLGVGKIYALGFVGDDGRGLELCRGLDKLGINRDNLVQTYHRGTHAYTKPWMIEPDGSKWEMSRIDIKNWTKTPVEVEMAIISNLQRLAPKLDALIVMDQITEENCGVVTDDMRRALAALAREYPDLLIFADSRRNIGQFDGLTVKGNQFELTHAVYGISDTGSDAPVKLASDPSVERTEAEIDNACETLQKRNDRPVICTMGEKGVRIYSESGAVDVPSNPVTGQTDVCGAGDMFTANFVTALAAGADIKTAAKLGNAAAAICVGQIGTSGHVTPDALLDVQ